MNDFEGDFELVGTVIDETPSRILFGAAETDNESDWPFPGSYWRLHCWANEIRVMRPGHDGNGSGAVVRIAPDAVERSIAEWRERQEERAKRRKAKAEDATP